jgi:hypothetical protein
MKKIPFFALLPLALTSLLLVSLSAKKTPNPTPQKIQSISGAMVSNNVTLEPEGTYRATLFEKACYSGNVFNLSKTPAELATLEKEFLFSDLATKIALNANKLSLLSELLQNIALQSNSERDCEMGSLKFSTAGAVKNNFNEECNYNQEKQQCDYITPPARKFAQQIAQSPKAIAFITSELIKVYNANQSNYPEDIKACFLFELNEAAEFLKTYPTKKESLKKMFDTKSGVTNTTTPIQRFVYRRIVNDKMSPASISGIITKLVTAVKASQGKSKFKIHKEVIINNEIKILSSFAKGARVDFIALPGQAKGKLLGEIKMLNSVALKKEGANTYYSVTGFKSDWQFITVKMDKQLNILPN